MDTPGYHNHLPTMLIYQVGEVRWLCLLVVPVKLSLFCVVCIVGPLLGLLGAGVTTFAYIYIVCHACSCCCAV